MSFGSTPVKIDRKIFRPRTVPPPLVDLDGLADELALALLGPALVERERHPARQPVQELGRRLAGVEAGVDAVELALDVRGDVVENPQEFAQEVPAVAVGLLKDLGQRVQQAAPRDHELDGFVHRDQGAGARGLAGDLVRRPVGLLVAHGDPLGVEAGVAQHQARVRQRDARDFGHADGAAHDLARGGHGRTITLSQPEPWPERSASIKLFAGLFDHVHVHDVDQLVRRHLDLLDLFFAVFVAQADAVHHVHALHVLDDVVQVELEHIAAEGPAVPVATTDQGVQEGPQALLDRLFELVEAPGGLADDLHLQADLDVAGRTTDTMVVTRRRSSRKCFTRRRSSVDGMSFIVRSRLRSSYLGTTTTETSPSRPSVGRHLARAMPLLAWSVSHS
jgi:hypothetical protein